MTPTISCIIPCYNAMLTLERAVNSALSQDVSARVVLVDDCSTDDTWSIIASLADNPSVTGIRHSQNKRQGAALNTGMATCHTDYFLRLDQDDWLEPGSLKALQTALDENPDAMFAYGAIRYHGRRSTLAKPAPFKPADFYRHNASGYCYLFRRAVYEAGIRYIETGDLVNLGDWAHALDMVEAGYAGIALPDTTVLNYVYGWTGTSKALADNETAAMDAFKARYAKAGR
jgi:glycosyltransferase involved in cell wall biosynthesis